MKKSLHKRYCIWRYLYYFRLCQYCRGVRQNGTAGRLERRLAKYKARRYEKKKNIWSYRSCIEIGLDSGIGGLIDDPGKRRSFEDIYDLDDNLKEKEIYRSKWDELLSR